MNSNKFWGILITTTTVFIFLIIWKFQGMWGSVGEYIKGRIKEIKNVLTGDEKVVLNNTKTKQEKITNIAKALKKEANRIQWYYKVRDYILINQINSIEDRVMYIQVKKMFGLAKTGDLVQTLKKYLSKKEYNNLKFKD